MGNLVVMNLVLSLAVTVVGVAFARPAARAHGRGKAPCSTWGSATCASYSSAGLFVNFAQSSNMIMRGDGGAGPRHGHHGRRRHPQHGPRAGVHPRAARSGAGPGRSRVRHRAVAGCAGGRDAMVVRQAREDGAHRARGGVARGAGRGGEGGRVGHAHAGAHARPAGDHLPRGGRVGAARSGRCCSARRCASSRSRSSRCGA